MEFYKNLTSRSKPKITVCNAKTAYTKFTYFPDFERFGRKGYGPNFIAMMKKMAYDIAFSTGVKVKFNGEFIKIKDMNQYAKLFFDGNRNMLALDSVSTKNGDCNVLIVEQTDDEADEFGMRQISFANGNYTRDGGIHVTTCEDVIFKAMRTWWNEKNKPKAKGKSQKAIEKAKKDDKETPKVKKGDLEKYFFLFVTCTVKKPEFSSQTKYYLDGPKPPAPTIEQSHINKMAKWNFVESVEELLNSRLRRKIRSTEANKGGYVGSFGKKAKEANYAGKKGYKDQCVLFITEGDSAKGMVDNGITLLDRGQDYYGTFALKGKFLNVTNASLKDINNNEEVQMLKKILGLHYGDHYENDEDFESVRYQKKIVLVADADDDGIHIEGLVNNFFVRQFPGLVKRGLIGKLRTPIIRAKKGSQTEYFFTKKSFKIWLKKQGFKEGDIKGWNLKYYKGLGTLEDDDVEYIFTKKLEFVDYTYDDDDKEAMDKAFDKKYTDQRKEWLHETVYKHRGEESDSDEEELEDIIEVEDQDILTMTEFVNHVLINFYVDDNDRSLPSVFDGLKESQRKILYGCFLKKIYKNEQEMKVAQLGAYVAANTNYHHGEVNLFSTIVKLAQGFVGTNNIPLLVNNGNFGTRHSVADLNGAAAPRYIYTYVDPITRFIFREEDEKFGVLKYTEDEGKQGEPEHYLPIIPMLLVNGAQGIGSGWSTTIPQYNPLDLIKWVQIHIYNRFEKGDNGKLKEYPELNPWYNGFKGEIIKEDAKNTYTICGNMYKHPKKKDTFVIDELPVGMWSEKLKEKLEKMTEEKLIDPPMINHGKNSVNFEVKCKTNFTLNITNNMKCLKEKRSFNNLVTLCENGIPKKNNSPESIIKQFFNARYLGYVTRRKNMLEYLKNEHIKAKNKYRYVVLVYNKKINMRSFEDVNGLEAFLEKPTVDGIEPFNRVNGTYDYLTRMLMTSMTKKNIERLKDDIEKLKTEHANVAKKKSWMLWKEDLEELKNAYPSFLERRNWEKVKGGKSMVVKKKK